ncbi:MAG: trypsin-like peptidase domain-containing protein [Ruminococcus sp.]|nr:trypsin-like peptidase domain-containing protein [Ruminococcus sp.]
MKRCIKRFIAGFSAIIMSVTTNSMVSALDNNSNMENHVEQFIVASKDTNSGEITYKNFDTKLTTNARNNKVNELSTPAYQGSISQEEEISPNNVIGNDDRYRITHTTDFPYRTICRIVTYWDKDNDGVIDNTMGIGTGFLEGPNAVVTAGHVIYDKNLNMWCEYAIITPAQDGAGSAPYGNTRSTIIHTSTAWIESGSADQDWGLIETQSDIGNQVGWLGKFWTSGSLDGTSVHVTGYPGDKPQTMWRGNGSITKSESARLFYNCDTMGAESGAPVLNSSNQALAIHANGGSYNSGTRITEWLFNFLEQFN